MGHSPSENGIFTDSLNYSHIVRECSNLSVGYFNEHTQQEYLNVDYLEELIRRLIKVNWYNVKVARSFEEDYLLDDFDETDPFDVSRFL
jgi:DNA-dependent RNA polymerase auxiliary subunit epsilon